MKAKLISVAPVMLACMASAVRGQDRGEDADAFRSICKLWKLRRGSAGRRGRFNCRQKFLIVCRFNQECRCSSGCRFVTHSWIVVGGEDDHARGGRDRPQSPLYF